MIGVLGSSLRPASVVHQTISRFNVSTHRVKVAILLCTYNGERFLQAQLDSLTSQIHTDWELWVSDDGSQDGTIAILTHFQQQMGLSRVHILSGPQKGFARNFLSLISRVPDDYDLYAFSDQDDVWFEGKLSQAVFILKNTDSRYDMYCSRSQLIDADGRVLGLTRQLRHPPSFRNALVENISCGNTIVITRKIKRLLQRETLVEAVQFHDWWVYIFVSATGGKIFFDPEYWISYRQHTQNSIGLSQGLLGIVNLVSRTLSGGFKEAVRGNLTAIESITPALLSPDSAQVLTHLLKGRSDFLVTRLRSIKVSEIHRQTRTGTLSLYYLALTNRLL